MSDEPLSFEEHRRRRDETRDLVRCARCGKMILAEVVRCPECGVHFQGTADEFAHPLDRSADRRVRWWMIVAAVLALAALLLSALGML